MSRQFDLGKSTIAAQEIGLLILSKQRKKQKPKPCIAQRRRETHGLVPLRGKNQDPKKPLTESERETLILTSQRS
jgi:hypothetical protein